MSLRPLVFVSGLTVGDYFLWNWSLNSNHDVLALASGLTLPPLAVAALWLAALALARLIARAARSSGGRRHAPSRAQSEQARETTPAREDLAAASPKELPGGGPPRKIAA